VAGLTVRVELLIAEGRVVRRRLAPGSPRAVVSDDPAGFAARLAAQGAPALSVTDLDAVRAGAPFHLGLAAEIARAAGVEVGYRGGLVTPSDVERALDAGLGPLVLDTAAFGDPAVLRFAVDLLGPRLAVALDAEGDAVRLPFGDAGPLPLVDAAAELAYRGVSDLVYTDLARAGTLTGPNLSGVAALCDAVGVGVTCAGGVRNVADIRALAGLGHANLRAVMLATALHEGRLDLIDALAAATADQGDPT
jgi:phosphoribosylformimino-5-aminoimidazole carboxamide ribotide isomerase